MGGRRERVAGSGADPGPDEGLPFLDRTQAHSLRRLLVRAVEARGAVVVAVHQDRLVLASGPELGFWNLAVACSSEDERQWPQVAAEHADRIVAALAQPRPHDGLSHADAARRTVSRLVATDAMPDLLEHR